MLRALLIAVLLLAVASCVSPLTTATGDTTKENYFPEFAFDERIGDILHDGKLKRNWYSRHLAALEEPSLLETLNDQKTYFRFVWLRTFHNPVAIRIELSPDFKATLFYKIADGAGGYEPGRLTKSESRSLSQSEIDTFLNLFASINICEESPDEFPGFDGSQWIFERRKANNYCVVDRWSPRSGPYWELGRYMMILAKFEETDDQPIY
jgi:hypothetical protein